MRMTKILKISGNIILSVIEILLIFIIAIAFLIRTSWFQTYLAQKATVYLSEYLDTKVDIGKVDLSFIDRVYFDNLYLEDQKQDTLAFIEEFYVNYDLRGALRLKFHLNEVKLTRASFHLKKHEGESKTNLQFIVDAFKTDKEKDPVNFLITSDNVHLVDCNFSFVDENKERIPYGVDFADLHLNNVNLQADHVSITKDTYSANLKTVSFSGSSGFDLNDFKAQALFSNQGLVTSNVTIETPHSSIKLPKFNLIASEIKDFSKFVDVIQMESHLDSSYVSLKDVSYFAPQLKGMDDIVFVKGKTLKSVNDLALNDIYLKYGNGTVVKGDFSLPDFRNLSRSNISQRLDYFSINVNDIERLRLPESSSYDYIKWPKTLENLTFIEGYNFVARGSSTNINMSFSRVNTNIGGIKFVDNFQIVSDTSFSVIQFIPLNHEENQISLEDLDMGKLLKMNDIGVVNGNLSLESAQYDQTGFKVNRASGRLNKTKILDYTYDYITLDNVNYHMRKGAYGSDHLTNGNVYVRDENLDLSFKGIANIGRELEIVGDIDLECAVLSNVFPSLENQGELSTLVFVEMRGKDFNDFRGRMVIDSLFYEESGKVFETNDFNGYIVKSPEKDSIAIASSFIDANVFGQINYSEVTSQLTYQLNEVFPGLNLPDKRSKTKASPTYFDYDILCKNLNPLFDIFYPKMQIAYNTHIAGNYNEERKRATLNLASNFIDYDVVRFNNINTMTEISNGELLALLDVNAFELRDSVFFKDIHFTGLAYGGELDGQIMFDNTDNLPSNIEVLVNLQDPNIIFAHMLPSFITIGKDSWNSEEVAYMSYSNKCFYLEDFKIGHENQYIKARGYLSDNEADKMYIDLMDVRLEEIQKFFDSPSDFYGLANVTGYLTSPMNGIQFNGDAIVSDLKINDREVGDVSFGANYYANAQKIDLYGNIFSLNEQTFFFDGQYYLDREDNLDINMIFNSTDIAVANEFLDPKVIKDLQGKLDGIIHLTGSLNEPIIKGKLDFHEGMVNLALLGANFYFEGEIESEEDGVFINQMPIKDEEGNVGSISGSLYHNHLKDMYFELVFNLEEHPTKRMPTDMSRALPVDRFLVMNTDYEIGSAYYGKAFITGMANISGYADNLSINVNAETKRGTRFVIPMYGPTTIEEEGYITFKKSGSEEEDLEKKVDLSGVDLNLNISVTDDAEVKIILDDKVDDELTARGEGDIVMSVNQFNELAMEGTYTVASGGYNFVLGPYKQYFTIKPGGTIQWTGNPYDAFLDLSAYYKTSANLAIAMPDILDSKSSSNQEIYSYINLTGQLMDPNITFDIEAPKASESGNAVISRIRNDKDELNKQFFSLLVSKSFMPITGGGIGTSSGAFLDLASTQINSILNRMTDGYEMNVNLDNDDISGQFSGEVGISKSFLDDRLLVSGSVGVGTKKNELGGEAGTNESQFLGDVTIEYLLNKKGTFRLSVFNESNNNYLIQDEGRGQFTQGVGISYKESFYTTKDFKLFQFFANLFRKKENWIRVQDEHDNRIPIPEEYLKKEGVIED